MKLSEAILAGCKIAPVQIYHIYARVLEDEKTLGACALGAACLGFGAHWYEAGLLVLKEHLPELEFAWDLRERVVHMNDKQKLTREQIAASLAKEGL